MSGAAKITQSGFRNLANTVVALNDGDPSTSWTFDNPGGLSNDSYIQLDFGYDVTLYGLQFLKNLGGFGDFIVVGSDNDAGDGTSDVIGSADVSSDVVRDSPPVPDGPNTVTYPIDFGVQRFRYYRLVPAGTLGISTGIQFQEINPLAAIAVRQSGFTFSPSDEVPAGPDTPGTPATPGEGGGVASGFTALDPATATSGVIISNNGLTIGRAAGTVDQGAFGLAADKQDSGKYYFEWQVLAIGTSGFCALGIAADNATFSGMGNSPYTGAAIVFNSGNIRVGSATPQGVGAFAIGDVVAIAADLDNKRFWAKNVTKATNWNNNASNDPATNVGGYDLSGSGSSSFFPACVIDSGNTANFFATLNPGIASFAGSVPSGFTSGWPGSYETNVNNTQLTIITDGTLSNQNLTWDRVGSAGASAAGVKAANDIKIIPGKKVYWEVSLDTKPSSWAGEDGIGVCTDLATLSGLGNTGANGAIWFLSGRSFWSNSASVGNILASPAQGDVIGVAVDATVSPWTIQYFNVTQSLQSTAQNISATSIPSMVPVVISNDSATTHMKVTFNFGATDFVGTPPTGFDAYDPVTAGDPGTPDIPGTPAIAASNKLFYLADQDSTTFWEPTADVFASAPALPITPMTAQPAGGNVPFLEFDMGRGVKQTLARFTCDKVQSPNATTVVFDATTIGTDTTLSADKTTMSTAASKNGTGRSSQGRAYNDGGKYYVEFNTFVLPTTDEGFESIAVGMDDGSATGVPNTFYYTTSSGTLPTGGNFLETSNPWGGGAWTAGSRDVGQVVGFFLDFDAGKYMMWADDGNGTITTAPVGSDPEDPTRAHWNSLSLAIGETLYPRANLHGGICHITMNGKSGFHYEALNGNLPEHFAAWGGALIEQPALGDCHIIASNTPADPTHVFNAGDQDVAIVDGDAIQNGDLIPLSTTDKFRYYRLVFGNGAGPSGNPVYEATFAGPAEQQYLNADYDSIWGRGDRAGAGLITFDYGGKWTISGFTGSGNSINAIADNNFSFAAANHTGDDGKAAVGDYFGWDFGDYGLNICGLQVYASNSQSDIQLGILGGTGANFCWVPVSSTIWDNNQDGFPYEVLFDPGPVNFPWPYVQFVVQAVNSGYSNLGGDLGIEWNLKVYHSPLDGGDRTDSSSLNHVSASFSSGISLNSGSSPITRIFDGTYSLDNAGILPETGVTFTETGHTSAPITTPGEWIKYTFPRKVAMREMVWNVENDETGAGTVWGTWQWQGSNDDTTWTDVGNPWSFKTGTTWMLAPNQNKQNKEFLEWRMVLTGGSLTNEPVFQAVFNLVDTDALGSFLTAGFTDNDSDGFKTATVSLGAPAAPFSAALTDGTDDEITFTPTIMLAFNLTAPFSDSADDQITFRTPWDPSTVVQIMTHITGR